MYYTYVIESQKNKDLYKGFCGDLKKRLAAHNDGSNKSTTNDRPWKLIYYEAFQNKEDAIERERFLKTGWGRMHLKKILKNYLKNN